MHYYNIIKDKITNQLSPIELNIIDESYKHLGHSGHDGTGETHFHLRVISSKFTGLTRVKRHQLIYKVLETEMQTKIHALSLETLTPDES